MNREVGCTKQTEEKHLIQEKLHFRWYFCYVLLMSCLIFIIRIRDYKHDHWALFKCEICNRCNDNQFFCFSWNTFLSLLKRGFWLDLAHSSFDKHTHTQWLCSERELQLITFCHIPLKTKKWNEDKMLFYKSDWHQLLFHFGKSCIIFHV